MFFSSLSLVQSGQPSVVPLVEPPGLLHGQVSLADLLEDGGKGLLGALKHRGVGHVEGVARRLECLAAGSGAAAYIP